jgi:hypothetical protein
MMSLPDKSLIPALRSSLDIDLKEGLSVDELRRAIADYINPLITGNFNKLISILYRLDISEPKLKQFLSDNPDKDAGAIIADLIIESQVQKIKSRRAFRSKGENNIDENEKW